MVINTHDVYRIYVGFKHIGTTMRFLGVFSGLWTYGLPLELMERAKCSLNLWVGCYIDVGLDFIKFIRTELGGTTKFLCITHTSMLSTYPCGTQTDETHSTAASSQEAIISHATRFDPSDPYVQHAQLHSL